MKGFSSRSDSHAGSFLPEEYLHRKAEIRSIVISFGLFCVVITGIVGAFFVTNRQWATVKTRQEEINRAYAVETAKIEQLKELERQKSEMIDKAEVTTALIEKVPRSIMLAEIINRMPKELTLTSLQLKSTRLDAKPVKIDRRPTATGSSAATNRARATRPARAGTQQQAADPPKPRVRPPSYDFKLEMIGLAATDDEIADYQTALKACPLLRNVELIYTSAVRVDDVPMRKFRLEASIRTDIDARNIEPLQVPRLPPRPSLATGPNVMDITDFDPSSVDPTVPNSPVFTNVDPRTKE
ncbi:MAG: PilN domain-containing protein [Phycisphaeraceae bacterium]|nr:PilN domain-containing protein [Phycisphaeraceae bacterium]